MDTFEADNYEPLSLRAVQPLGEGLSLLYMGGEQSLTIVPVSLSSEELESLSQGVYTASIVFTKAEEVEKEDPEMAEVLSFEAYVQRKRGNA